MRKVSFAAALLAGGLFLQGFDNKAVSPDSADQTTTTTSTRLGGGNYKAHLTGDEEVAAQPVVATNATGQVNLTLNKDGTQLYDKLIVTNIESVRFAHLHLTPAGINGPVVVDLFMPATPVLSPQGVLAEGVITASLIGFLAIKPLPEPIAAIETANVYADVHSNQYSSGELRG